MKKQSVKSLKKKAWDLCSEYVRIRDAIETTGTKTHAVCCTCGKTYPAFGKGCLQAGHFISGRNNSILFDVRGIAAQCYNCNINLKSNWPRYHEYMKRKYGQEIIDELIQLSYQSRKYFPFELEEIIEDFKKKIKELNE